MAENKINKETILNRAQLFSQNNASRIASNLIQGISQVAENAKGNLKNLTYTPFNKSNEAKIENIMKFVEGANSDQFASIVSVLNKEVLSSLNGKQLNAISEIVSKVDRFVSRANELAVEGNNEYLVSQNMEAASIYRQAVEEMAPYFEGINIVQAFGVNSVESAWQIVDEDKPSKADIELVEAFKLIGVSLRLNHKNEWVWENIPAEEVKKYGLPNMGFRFSKEEVNSLIDGYLNNPDRNGRIITPEGLFKVYRERATQLIDGQNLTDTEKSLIKTKLNEHYSRITSGSDRELLELTDEVMLMKTAEKLAFAEIAKENFENINLTDGVPSYSEELQQLINNSDFINKEKGARKSFSRLHFGAIGANDAISDRSTYANLESYLGRYDKKIEALKNLQKSIINGTPNPDKLEEIQTQIQLLEMSKESLQDNVTFIKSFASQSLKGNTSNREEVLEQIKYSANNFWVKSNGEDLTVEDRHNGAGQSSINPIANSALAEALKERIKRKAQQNATSATTGNSNSSSSSASEILREFYNYPEFLGIAMSSEAEGGNKNFADAMNAMTQLTMFEVLFAPDAPFYNEFEEYKKNNPDATIENFVDNEILGKLDGAEDIYKREYILAGYDKAMVEANKKPQLEDNNAQVIDDTYRDYGSNLVLLDRAIRSFTPEELAKFQDDTCPDEAKRQLIKMKMNEAKAKGNIIPGNEEYNEAIARHSNNVLGNLLTSEMSSWAEGEKEAGKSPDVSNCLKKYIDKIAEEQKEIDEKLDAEKENAEKLKKLGRKKYGEMRPSTVDQVKFEKAMKGYSGKELKKNFIKLILKDMKTILYIDMDAYNARQNQDKPLTDNKENEQGSDNNKPTQEGATQDGVDPNDPNQQANPQQPDPQQNPQGAQSNQPDPQQNSQQHIIGKIKYDAAVFMPGMCLIDKTMSGLDRNSKEFENLNNLKSAFFCLTSVDNLGNEFSVKGEDGKDFRDVCREIAFDICSGGLKNGQEVQQKLDEAINKYGIPQVGYVQQIKKGFSNLTPELMHYLFEFSSESKVEINAENKKINKIALGKWLPLGLESCESDSQRMKTIRNYMEKNLINFNEGSELLNMIINDVYAKEGSVSGFENTDDMEIDGM